MFSILRSSADSIDPTSLLQYGVTGVVAALAIIGLVWLYKRREADWDRERVDLNKHLADEKARGDRLEEELSKLNTMVQTQTMTALNEAQRAVSDAIAFRARR